MRSHRWHSVVGLFVLFATNAGSVSERTVQTERRFLTVDWTKTVVVKGELDSELLRPELMVARDSTFYVYDYGDQSVKAFSERGLLLWRFGRGGRGPGEFVNPTDLQVDGEGRVWLCDPATSRITVVSTSGRLVRTIQTETPIERLVSLGEGRFLGFVHSGPKPKFTRYDSLGGILGSVPHPSWMDTIPSLVSELRMTAAPGNNTVIVGSYYSGRIMKLQSGAARFQEITTVETYQFPKPITYAPSKQMTVRRLPPDARPTIRSISADAEFSYALIFGGDERRGRIIDRYKLSDGSYSGSWLLPERISAISVTKRGIAALVVDPLPSLYYFSEKPVR